MCLHVIHFSAIFPLLLVLLFWLYWILRGENFSISGNATLYLSSNLELFQLPFDPLSIIYTTMLNPCIVACISTYALLCLRCSAIMSETQLLMLALIHFEVSCYFYWKAVYCPWLVKEKTWCNNQTRFCTTTTYSIFFNKAFLLLPINNMIHK